MVQGCWGFFQESWGSLEGAHPCQPWGSGGIRTWGSGVVQGFWGSPGMLGVSWGELRALWGSRIPEGGQGLGDATVTPTPFLCSLQEAPGKVSGGSSHDPPSCPQPPRPPIPSHTSPIPAGLPQSPRPPRRRGRCCTPTSQGRSGRRVSTGWDTHRDTSPTGGVPQMPQPGSPAGPTRTAPPQDTQVTYAELPGPHGRPRAPSDIYGNVLGH